MGTESNFNGIFYEDSSNDDTIFVTQSHRVNVNEESKNELDKVILDIDMEELLNSTRDSAIGSVASIAGSDKSIRELPYKEFVIFNLKLKDH